METRRYSISEGEWKVMEMVWRCPGASLHQIVAALEGSGWSYSTIKTLVGRLVNKGLIMADRSVGNSFRYTAAVDSSTCRVQEAHSFLSRVFDGSVSLMMAALARESRLTPQERAELERLAARLDNLPAGEKGDDHP